MLRRVVYWLSTILIKLSDESRVYVCVCVCVSVYNFHFTLNITIKFEMLIITIIRIDEIFQTTIAKPHFDVEWNALSTKLSILLRRPAETFDLGCCFFFPKAYSRKRDFKSIDLGAKKVFPLKLSKHFLNGWGWRIEEALFMSITCDALPICWHFQRDFYATEWVKLIKILL